MRNRKLFPPFFYFPFFLSPFSFSLFSFFLFFYFSFLVYCWANLNLASWVSLWAEYDHWPPLCFFSLYYSFFFLSFLSPLIFRPTALLTFSSISLLSSLLCNLPFHFGCGRIIQRKYHRRPTAVDFRWQSLSFRRRLSPWFSVAGQIWWQRHGRRDPVMKVISGQMRSVEWVTSDVWFGSFLARSSDVVREQLVELSTSGGIWVCETV